MDANADARRSSSRIRGFDGLRAVAFILVFLSHKIGTRAADPFGSVGVVLFFVLSGFLITRILANMRSEVERGRSTPVEGIIRFYIRRGVRIFPPYYLLLAVMAAIWLFEPIDHFWLRHKLAYSFYWTNIFIANQGWVGDFGHFWTLAIEQQFYVAFAPLILFTRRRFTLAICAATALVGVFTIPVLQAAGSSSLAISMNSLVSFAMLGFGGLVGLLADRPLPRWLIVGRSQFAVLCLLLILPVVIPTTVEAWIIWRNAAAVVAGVLLLQVTQGQSTWVTKSLDAWPLREIGLVSYGAYLVHNFIHFSMLEQFLARYDIAVSAPPSFAMLAEFLVTLAIATLSWRYVERPIMQRGAEFSSRVSARPNAVLKAT